MPPAPVNADELDRDLQQQTEVYQIPATVVGVIRGGQLVDSRAGGLANIELNVSATPQNAFEVGSISKLVGGKKARKSAKKRLRTPVCVCKIVLTNMAAEGRTRPHL